MGRALVLLGVLALIGCSGANGAATQTRAVELTAVAPFVAASVTPTCCPGQGPPVGAPSAYYPTFVSAYPTSTLSSLQATSEAIRQRQQGEYVATMTSACDTLRRKYEAAGQVFDQSLAVRDPQRMLVELRILDGGTGEEPLSILGPQRDQMRWDLIMRCAGR